MYLNIHLGTNKDYTLTYKLARHTVAEKIWTRFISNQYEYVSRTQFYNWGESVQDVEAKLDESFAKINELAPQLDISPNHIPSNFADIVLRAKGEVRHGLNMLNYHLNHYQDITKLGNKRFLLATNSGGPGPIFLEDSEFELFSPTRLPNHLYMNYPHIGKHILDVCAERDPDIDEDSIVPTYWLKNDLLAWFGPPQFENPTEVLAHVNDYLLTIEDRLP